MFHVKQIFINEIRVRKMNILGIVFPAELILFYAAIALLVLLIISISGLVIAMKANNKMKKVLKDAAGNDITDAVVNYYKKCTDIMNRYHEAESRLEEVERNMGSCVKKIGAIRYSAFDNSSAKLSFAAAILDDSDSGFVLNGVYSRGQTATYLKPIQNGKSAVELSEEEMEAIKTAQYNYEKKMQMNLKQYDEK